MQKTNIRIQFNTYLLRKLSIEMQMSYIKKHGQAKVANLEDDTIAP